MVNLYELKKLRMGLFQFLKNKLFLKQIIIVIIGLFLSVLFLQWWLGYETKHNQKIQVPDLHKKTLSEVKASLDQINLKYVVIDSASYNPNYRKKSVIEQEPKAGDFVKENRKIYLTLNPSKYVDIKIPDLNSWTKRLAETHLKSIGFKIGKNITWVPGIGKNVVRGLKHNGVQIGLGDKLPKNSVIDLILENGKLN